MQTLHFNKRIIKIYDTYLITFLKSGIIKRFFGKSLKMESFGATSQVIYVENDRSIDTTGHKSGYELDIWREVRKRWMVLGVLLAMALAVLAPHFGAPGGNYMHAHVVIY